MIEIGALSHFVGGLRSLLIFVRRNDVAINFLQVASQSALFPAKRGAR
jgi:hypothetical protein